MLQAAKIGRLGGGHLLVVGVTPNFIAVSVLALEEGGPSMLASLIVLSSLFYLAVATWLPLLRRIITPVVAGTVLMLIAATILPICFDRLQEVPEGTSMAGRSDRGRGYSSGVPHFQSCAAPGLWRPLSLLVGIGAGLRRRYSVRPVRSGSLVGGALDRNSRCPISRSGPNANGGLLGAASNVPDRHFDTGHQGDRRRYDRSTRGEKKATRNRLSHGSRLRLGEWPGILASGFAGTPPTSSYSSFTVSLINLTGVAARSVGYAMGGILLVLALFPKLTGALLIVPSPVMGGFLLVAVGMFFVEGITDTVEGRP